MSQTSISNIKPDEGSLTYAGYGVWKGIVPLPPFSLLWSVGGATLEQFLVVGDAWGQFISRFCPESATVLEIGCGCGRAPRVLLNNPWVTHYIGFDVIPANIEWCNNFLAPAWRHGKAEFHCYDLYSGEYNPNGSLQTSEFRFPCEDGKADLIVAASVFTHLLEPDAIHYLRESARVLSNRGHALFSIHTAVLPGEKYRGNETRIDVDMDYFLELAAAAGLSEASRLDELTGQQVLILRKA